jgi:Fe2+ transport system protein B
MRGRTVTADKELIDALVKNTEALAHMNAVQTAFQTDYAQGRQAAKEHVHNMASKVDNLDRSVSEIRLAVENSERHRQEELKRIYDLLTDERKDRKEVTATAGKDERELLREIIREEMGDRKERRNIAVDASKAIWAAGGNYIVAAVAFLIVAAVMKLTGTNLADVLGLVGK